MYSTHEHLLHSLYSFLAFAIFLLVGFTSPSHAEIITIQSDGTWKSSQRQSPDWVDCPGTIGDSGPVWTAPDFDDSNWGNATSPWYPYSGCVPAPGDTKPYIWMGSQSTPPLEAFFRKSFILNSLPTNTTATIFVDDNHQFYINGTFVDRKSWIQPDVLDVSSYLRIGENVIAFRTWDGDPQEAACGIYKHGCQSLAFNLTIELPDVPDYSCSGFQSPMDKGPVSVRKKRALPLKAQLFDENLNVLGNTDLSSIPVIQIVYYPANGEESIDVTDDALAVGRGTEGNQFEYDNVSQLWRYNLKTINYSAAGTYVTSIISGDSVEYQIEPTCTARFIIQ